MRSEPARNSSKLESVGPTNPQIVSELLDNTLIGQLAAFNCPIALTLATLAGEVVYGNARAMQIFECPPSDSSGRYLSDFCIDPGQMAEIEAVARDGQERQFQLSRDIKGIGARSFLCRVSRVAGRTGIPTWIAFAAQELEAPSSPQAGAELSDAATLHAYRSVAGSAVWRMKLDHHPAQWLKNAVEWTRERFSLMNIRGRPTQRTAKSFLDLVHASDRAMVAHTIESSLRNAAPFEIVYRLAPRFGRTQVILTRGILVGDACSTEGPSLCAVDIDISSVVDQGKIPFDQSAVLEGISTHIDGPLYALDKNFRLIFFNDCFSRNMKELYGAQATLHARPFEPPSARSRRRVVLANFRRAMSGIAVLENVSVHLKDSGASSFELTYAPMIVASRTTGVVVFGVKSS